MAKPPKNDDNTGGAGTPTPPKEGKKVKQLSHTLKDNRLFIPGHGTVEKENFNQEHFDTLVKLDKDAVKKYLVKVGAKEEDTETEE